MASYIFIVVATIIGMIVSSFIGYYVCQWRKAIIKARQENNMYKDSKEQSQAHDLELPIFDLDTVYAATDKFSPKNKIGQGGFGPVYKGELPNGQEIAVKRLSQGSGQGLEEFKNEVVLFAKLQHRNLVRLLGCCIQGEERMLVYEFLPNKSLDHFIFGMIIYMINCAMVCLNFAFFFRPMFGILNVEWSLNMSSPFFLIHFLRTQKITSVCWSYGQKLWDQYLLPSYADPTKKKLLPWKNRFNIIVGIARGLLYLHEDSRLRIIHRDLKASNVLLDDEMYPKISDFGIARIFGGDQKEHMTNRVIGTYGYMSPEYAMSGHFSVKSDAFSFGVLVLEIISGKRNWGYNHPEHNLNLVGYAWKLWSEQKPLEITDQAIEYYFPENEVVTRCIQVGLLCVQQRMEDRPTMSQAVFMLSNESASLPEPREPGFYVENFSLRVESSSSWQTTNSVNEVTITAVAGR